MHTCAFSISHKIELQNDTINPREDKVVWRHCLSYIIGTIAIAMLMILTYDVGRTEGRYNGYCSKHDPIFFTMVMLMYGFIFINAPIQIAMFIIYLYYWYKMRNVRDIISYQINRKIFCVAACYHGSHH